MSKITIKGLKPGSGVAIVDSTGTILFQDVVFWDNVDLETKTSQPEEMVLRVRKAGFLPQETKFNLSGDWNANVVYTEDRIYSVGPLPEITSVEVFNAIVGWAKEYFDVPIKGDPSTPDIIMIKSIGMIKCSNPVEVTRKVSPKLYVALEDPKLFDKLEEFFNG